MTRLTLLLVVVAGCGGRTHVTSGMTHPMTGTASLGPGRVYIPVKREHYSEYKTDGGVIAHMLVGSHEAQGETTEVDKVEKLGTIVVDLRTGRCSLAANGTTGSLPSYWLRPLALAAGRPVTTPSGHQVSWANGAVTARRDGVTRSLREDPERVGAWIPDSDAIVVRSRLIDVVDDDAWFFEKGIVRFGDRLFVPTEHEVLELTLAPLTRVAAHVPDAALPYNASTNWLTPKPWVVGATHHDVTLEQTPDGLALVREGSRVELRTAGVYVFDDSKIAASDGVLINLETMTTKKEIPGYPRIARWGPNSLLLVADGRHWTSDDRLVMQTRDPHLRTIGFDGASFVLEDSAQRAIFVFELSTRTWRDYRYKSCMPINAP